MKARSEPRDPPPHCLGLVEDVAEEIQPDDPNLAPWFENYARQHRRRLAMDLHLLESTDPGLGVQCQQILEIGAVPLLLTAALSSSFMTVASLALMP